MFIGVCWYKVGIVCPALPRDHRAPGDLCIGGSLLNPSLFQSSVILSDGKLTLAPEFVNTS